ncbi:UNVERIFIED_CONTAM: putative plant SNARE 13 [Sesamum indicum]
MANLQLQMNPTMEQIHGEIRDTMRALANGFQKLDKIKDSNRQSKQLEELTEKMRECKRLIKEFDREIKDEDSRNPPEVNKQLNDEKQSMIKELNSYVALRKTYLSTLGNKRVELFDMGTGPSETTADDNAQVASEMSNQELIHAGMKTMDETDQAIERSKQVVHQTIEVGTQTATTLKGQTEQMGRIVNELDTIQFSIKKASQLVKEIGRQVATDKCIMFFLFLIVCGVIAIIVVKICVLLDRESKQQKYKGYPWTCSSCSNDKEIAYKAAVDMRTAVCDILFLYTWFLIELCAYLYFSVICRHMGCSFYKNDELSVSFCGYSFYKNDMSWVIAIIQLTDYICPNKHPSATMLNAQSSGSLQNTVYLMLLAGAFMMFHNLAPQSSMNCSQLA